MRKERSKIVDKTIQTVEGFEKVYKVIQQNTVLRGQSKSTFHNYLRRIAFISLHFGRLPENISDEEIREYLTGLALDPKSPSRSSFKHIPIPGFLMAKNPMESDIYSNKNQKMKTK